MARLFIAIELSKQQKEEVLKLQQKLKGFLEGVSWVKPEGMHLTLKFLGDTEPDLIDNIKKAMDNSVVSVNQFKLAIGYSGVFPSVHKARVMWIGVREGETALKHLAQNLDINLSSYGFKPEKRSYKPHLTIGRIRRPIPVHLIKRFIEQENSFYTSSSIAEEIVLFESQLTPKGSIYTVLYKNGLAG